MDNDRIKTEYVIDLDRPTVTLNLKLDDIDLVVKALKAYRNQMRWNFASIHATDEERKQADLDIWAVDRILGGV